MGDFKIVQVGTLRTAGAPSPRVDTTYRTVDCPGKKTIEGDSVFTYEGTSYKLAQKRTYGSGDSEYTIELLDNGKNSENLVNTKRTAENVDDGVTPIDDKKKVAPSFAESFDAGAGGDIMKITKGGETKYYRLTSKYGGSLVEIPSEALSSSDASDRTKTPTLPEIEIEDKDKDRSEVYDGWRTKMRSFTHNQLAALLNDFDTNQDGLLSITEFIESGKAKNTKMDNLFWSAQALNLDGNRYITEDELNRFNLSFAVTKKASSEYYTELYSSASTQNKAVNCQKLYSKNSHETKVREFFFTSKAVASTEMHSLLAARKAEREAASSDAPTEIATRQGFIDEVSSEQPYKADDGTVYQVHTVVNPAHGFVGEIIHVQNEKLNVDYETCRKPFFVNAESYPNSIKGMPEGNGKNDAISMYIQIAYLIQQQDPKSPSYDEDYMKQCVMATFYGLVKGEGEHVQLKSDALESLLALIPKKAE